MLNYAIIFLIIAILAGVLGFGVVAGCSDPFSSAGGRGAAVQFFTAAPIAIGAQSASEKR